MQSEGKKEDDNMYLLFTHTILQLFSYILFWKKRWKQLAFGFLGLELLLLNEFPAEDNI